MLTTWDQHEALYAVMQNEKFVADPILLLMLIITVFLFSLVAAWYPSRKAGSAAIVGSLRK